METLDTPQPPDPQPELATGREIFVARQPILDRARNVFGYELLFRSGLNNAFSFPDGDQATTQVLINSFILFGLPLLTAGKPAFVNMTREVLVRGFAELFPCGTLVPEILETVVPDDEVLAACARLQQAGFVIALDDFVQLEGFEALAEIADIIKVDFMLTTPEQQKSLAQHFAGKRTRLLAEKVETPEEFERALALGYAYFQGYFFAKPEIMREKDVPGYKLHYLRLMQKLHKPDMKLLELEEIIKTDVSMSYRLLRYINSAFFGLRVKIGSIRHALTLLGTRNVRKWASLIAISCIGDDKPAELMMLALIRAGFCESIARFVARPDDGPNYFMLGMFSVLDAIADKPIEILLDEIAIEPEVHAALMGTQGTHRSVLELALAYEHGDWARITALSTSLAIDEANVPRLYLEAVDWARKSLCEQMTSIAPGRPI